MPVSEMRKYLSLYRMYDVDYYFVFTQQMLTDDMLTDYWGNVQLKLAEEFDSKVIVASEKLRAYIREKYPSIKLILSTTKMHTVEETLKEAENYDQIVISVTENFKLDQLPRSVREKTEILVNACCPPDCIKAKFCYIRSSSTNLGTYDPKWPLCFNRHKDDYLESCSWEERKKYLENYLTEDIEEAERLGVQYFKQSGRELPLERYVPEFLYYLIKEDMWAYFLMNMCVDLDLFFSNRHPEFWKSYNCEPEIPNVPDEPAFSKIKSTAFHKEKYKID